MPLIVFIVWITLEILVGARIAAIIGTPAWLFWMLASVALGVIVIRRSGWRAVHRIQAALAREELPAREMLDTALRFMAGGLLIVPGAISDVFGLLLLLPILRQRMLRTTVDRMQQTRPNLREPTIIEGDFTEVDDRPTPLPLEKRDP